MCVKHFAQSPTPTEQACVAVVGMVISGRCLSPSLHFSASPSPLKASAPSPGPGLSLSLPSFSAPPLPRLTRCLSVSPSQPLSILLTDSPPPSVCLCLFCLSPFTRPLHTHPPKSVWVEVCVSSRDLSSPPCLPGDSAFSRAVQPGGASWRLFSPTLTPSRVAGRGTRRAEPLRLAPRRRLPLTGCRDQGKPYPS